MATKTTSKSPRMTKKPFLSAGQKQTLRGIMKTVRKIRIWNQQHGK